jgi:hypothetical protein
VRDLVRDLALALRESVLPLLGSGAEYQISVVASANQALHDLILREVDAGIARVSR